MRKKNLLMSIIGLFTFIFLAGGVSYAYFVYNKDVAVVDLETGNISINFNNATNKISNVTTQPINDGTGKVLPYYLDFTVNGTTDTEAILYELEIVPNSGNTIDSQYVKVYLTDQNENELLSPFLYTELLDAEKNNGKALYQDLIEGNIDGTSKTTTKNYRLRVWIDESYDDVQGGAFSFSVYLYAKNIDTTNLEKVTFDTNDGRSNALVKYVTIGEDYGELPTPTREGYTFLGWNGKNLFNAERSIDGYIDDNTGLAVVASNSNSSDFISINPGGKYIIRPLLSSGNWGAFYDENKEYMSGFIYRDGNYITAPTNAKYIRFTINYINSNTNYGNTTQLEEGTEATSYEPYYVTSDVKVTRWNTDMVLKAIWQENS